MREQVGFTNAGCNFSQRLLESLARCGVLGCNTGDASALCGDFVAYRSGFIAYRADGNGQFARHLIQTCFKFLFIPFQTLYCRQSPIQLRAHLICCSGQTDGVFGQPAKQFRYSLVHFVDLQRVPEQASLHERDDDGAGFPPQRRRLGGHAAYLRCRVRSPSDELLGINDK